MLIAIHDSTAGKVISCVGALSAGWGTYLANAQSIAALVAALTATGYSLYMIYDLWDRRRKQQ